MVVEITGLDDGGGEVVALVVVVVMNLVVSFEEMEMNGGGDGVGC